MWKVLSSWWKWSPESGYGVRRGPMVKHSQHLRICWGKNKEGVLTSSGGGGEYVAQMINSQDVEGVFVPQLLCDWLLCAALWSLWLAGLRPRQVHSPSRSHLWKEKFRVVLVVCQAFKRNMTASQIKALIWKLCSILNFGWLFWLHS